MKKKKSRSNFFTIYTGPVKLLQIIETKKHSILPYVHCVTQVIENVPIAIELTSQPINYLYQSILYYHYYYQ